MNPVLMVNIIVGIALLVLGKRLFWLFVGAIGFIGASDAAAAYFSGLPHWQVLVICLGAGVLGALLAFLFQKAAILLVGFYAGGYLTLSLLTMLKVALPGNPPWAPFVIGGLLGAVLLYVLFDWTLIVLSSLAGAALIAQTIHPMGIPSPIVLLVLFLAGIIVQGSIMKKGLNGAGMNKLPNKWFDF